MLKYFSLLLICFSSLNADAPLSDGSHETGSTSSSSSVVQNASNATKSLDLPREILIEIMKKQDQWISDRHKLKTGHDMLQRNEGETIQDRVEGMYKLNEVHDIYFNDRTKNLINQESNIVINSVPKSLTFNTEPTAQEIQKLIQKFPNIERIDMRYSLKKSDAKADILKALGGFLKLNALNISYNSLNDDDARAIAENLKGLTRLELLENSITSEGAMALANNLKELRYLNLAWNQIWNDGVLAICHNLTNLTHLYIFNNDYAINDEIVGAIQNLAHLTTLFLDSGEDIESKNTLIARWKGDPSGLKFNARV